MKRRILILSGSVRVQPQSQALSPLPLLSLNDKEGKGQRAWDRGWSVFAIQTANVNRLRMSFSELLH